MPSGDPDVPTLKMTFEGTIQLSLTWTTTVVVLLAVTVTVCAALTELAGILLNTSGKDPVAGGATESVTSCARAVSVEPNAASKTGAVNIRFIRRFIMCMLRCRPGRVQSPAQ